MKKSTLPVSRKFYSELHQRVVSSVAAINGTDDDTRTILSAIDLYINCGTIPATEASPTLLLTFNLLRPEIDKAIARSCRARQRAAKKSTARKPLNPKGKTGSHATEKTPLTPCIENSDSDITDNNPPLNRRQRRLIDQACKRVARKLARHRA